ncbi:MULTISPECIES: hypothetical protein [Methylomonas]|uniref:Uncharacterized protein n=2 Tax=Methylomonas TaxID=416 RepID=A0A126T626_9GAMM|nr:MULTISPECIES: hypothetical protein [Methylomonas]AMK77525.1 hypothetical protein JT25_013705 [Methylomonas denitrificans]OAI05107.1 hypothetical protein A1342_11870 [Methylomonas methanica]TCV84433.1 hypothetical protein EDE11_10792 [Methylomonas methanica]
MKPNKQGPLLAGILIVASLSGCGQDQPKTIVAPSAPKSFQQTKTLHGTVSNNSGPVKVGSVSLYSENGKELARVELSDSQRYQIEAPAGTQLPVILTYTPPGGKSSEAMHSVVIYPDVSKYDINPTTTAIANSAKTMGGYTHGNMVRAAEGTAHLPQANKTTAGFRGDPTTQYGGWH